MVHPIDSKGKILIVDDDRDIVDFVTTVLSAQGYEVQSASTGKRGYEKRSQWNPDLVLLDVNIPDLDGLGVLQKIRQCDQESGDHTSIILLTAQSETRDIVRGLDAGADDYVCKPFLPEELLARVRAQIRSKKLYDQLQEANEKLNQLVQKDDLTDLYNMRSLYDKLENELQRAQRFKRSVCVIMLDMDHFKTVNDDHDHLFGSFILKEMGKIIQKGIRSIDFAARYGGDEFLIVLTEVDEKGAQLFCERLRETVENYHFASGEDEMSLTCSIGYAVTDSSGQDYREAKEMVRLADHSLYESKGKGRNQISGVNLSQLSDSDFEQMENQHKKRWRKFG